MRTQRYLLFLPGYLVDSSGGTPTSGTWPRQAVQQVATRVDFVVGGAVPVAVPTLFQLKLGAVVQAGAYSIPIGQIIGENNVNPPDGLTIPANVFPGIVCTKSGGAGDVAVYLMMTDSPATVSTDPWVNLTLADLQAQITSQELAEWTTAILQQGQPETVTALLDQCTKFVRGFVARGGNVMGLEGTVPCELIDTTLNLVKERLFERAASLHKFSEQARLVARDERNFLTDVVADGKFTVSMPTTLAVNRMQEAAQVEIATPSLPRQFSRSRLNGLQ